MLLEIGTVAAGVGRDIAPQHRHPFGADHMIGRRRALLGDSGKVFPLRKGKGLGIRMPHRYHRKSGHGRELLAQRSQFQAKRSIGRSLAWTLYIPCTLGAQVVLGATH